MWYTLEFFRVNDFWAPFCCFNGRVTINLGGEGWVSVFFSWGKQVSEEQSSEIALDDYGHTSNRLFHPQPGHTALIVLFYTTLSGLCSSDIVRPKSSSEEDSMGWRSGLNAFFQHLLFICPALTTHFEWGHGHYVHGKVTPLYDVG